MIDNKMFKLVRRVVACNLFYIPFLCQTGEFQKWPNPPEFPFFQIKIHENKPESLRKDKQIF